MLVVRLHALLVQGVFVSASLFDSPPARRARLPRVVIISAGETSTAWRVLAMHNGWEASCACGRQLHQWATPHRPSAVQCPGCRKWVQAP